MAPRLLEYPPVYCSACWCAQLDKRHVDFDADNDQGYGNDPSHTVAYDNLQLCEDCMKSGARIVGMVDGEERQKEIDTLTAERDKLQREKDKAQNYSDRLEDAFKHRSKPIELDHRQKPRQVHREVRSG